MNCGTPTSLRHGAALVVWWGAACGAIAQVPATAIWQTSLDSGATWQGGYVVVSPSQTVDVRLVVGWDPGDYSDPTCFFDARFDGVVSGAGVDDSVSNIMFVQRSLFRPPTYPVSVQRQGSLLKIDGEGDLAPPGVGPSALNPNQNPYGVGQIPDFSNPLPILSYRLALDGSPGTRTISGAFNTYPNTANPWLRIWFADQVYPFAEPLTQIPASVEVIPAPTGIVPFVVALTLAMRRRR